MLPLTRTIYRTDLTESQNSIVDRFLKAKEELQDVLPLLPELKNEFQGATERQLLVLEGLQVPQKLLVYIPVFKLEKKIDELNLVVSTLTTLVYCTGHELSVVKAFAESVGPVSLLKTLTVAIGYSDASSSALLWFFRCLFYAHRVLLVDMGVRNEVKTLIDLIKSSQDETVVENGLWLMHTWSNSAELREMHEEIAFIPTLETLMRRKVPRLELLLVRIVYCLSTEATWHPFLAGELIDGIVKDVSEDCMFRLLAVVNVEGAKSEKSDHLMQIHEEHPNLFQEMVEMYKQCVASTHQHRLVRVDGIPWSEMEILLAISNLSQSDSVKKQCVEEGVVELLVNSLHYYTHTYIAFQQRALANTTRAMWVLSFSPEARTVILANNGIEALKEVSTAVVDVSPEVKRNVSGCLFLLEGQTQEKAVRTRRQSVVAVENVPHVMLSYCWDNQPLTLRVKEALKKRGYKVWIDVEQMGGSTLEAMANAVEGACLVLVFFSQPYSASPNCRLEAEYAFTARKPILPVLVQQDFRAAGWLGMLLGTKLWIEFKHDSDEAQFEKAVALLDREMRSYGVRPVNESKVSMRAVATAAAFVSKAPHNDAVSWGVARVGEWLDEIGLGDKRDSFAAQKISGRALRHLCLLHTSKQPDAGVAEILASLGLARLGERFAFLDHLLLLFNKIPNSTS